MACCPKQKVPCPVTSVSVVIPTSNRPDMLRRAILSVHAQTCAPDEIIVVDDGDGVEELPGDVQVLCSNGSGVSAARNLGIDVAGSDLIAILDDDDEWLPDKLERQVPLFSDPAVGIVHGGAIFVRDADGQTGSLIAESKRQFHDLLAWNHLVTQSLVFRRELALQVGGFNPRSRFVEDWEFCLAMTFLATAAGVAEPVVRIHQHDRNVSASTTAQRQIFSRALHVLRHAPRHEPCARCERQSRIGRQRILNDRITDAMNQLRRARVSGLPYAAWAMARSPGSATRRIVMSARRTSTSLL